MNDKSEDADRRFPALVIGTLIGLVLGLIVAFLSDQELLDALAALAIMAVIVVPTFVIAFGFLPPPVLCFCAFLIMMALPILAVWSEATETRPKGLLPQWVAQHVVPHIGKDKSSLTEGTTRTTSQSGQRENPRRNSETASQSASTSQASGTTARPSPDLAPLYTAHMVDVNRIPIDDPRACIPPRLGGSRTIDDVTCEIVDSRPIITITQLCYVTGTTVTHFGNVGVIMKYTPEDRGAARDLKKWRAQAGWPRADTPNGLMERFIKQMQRDLRSKVMQTWGDERTYAPYWIDLRRMRERLAELDCRRDDADARNLRPKL